MALWHPFRDSGSFFDAMDDRMERMFDRVFDRRMNVDGWPTVPSQAFLHAGGSHPMDLIENNKEFKIKADAPGMDPSDIDIRVKDNTLTISGERKDEIRETDASGEVIKLERAQRSFTRSFVLPRNADAEKISAALDKGVLEVNIAKKEAVDEGVRRIEVQSI